MEGKNEQMNKKEDICLFFLALLNSVAAVIDYVKLRR